jgi:hypothetical protein
LKCLEKACKPETDIELEVLSQVHQGHIKKTQNTLNKSARLLNYARTMIRKADMLENKNEDDEITKDKENLYISASKKIALSMKGLSQTAACFQIEVLGTIMAVHVHIKLKNYDEIKEEILHLKNLKNQIMNSHEVRNLRSQGKYDKLSEIVKQYYYYQRASFKYELLKHFTNNQSRAENKYSFSRSFTGLNKSMRTCKLF